jgi:hypothetical protein
MIKIIMMATVNFRMENHERYHPINILDSISFHMLSFLKQLLVNFTDRKQLQFREDLPL